MDQTYRETQSGKAGEVVENPSLAWQVHLLREEPAKAFLIAPFVAISLFVCYIIFHSPLFLAVTLFLFMSSLSEFLFPIRYTIDSRGALSRTLFGRNYIEWERVQKYYLDDHGIKLSPLRRQGRLEAFRGVYLRFGGHREQVIEAVRRLRDAQYTDAGTDG